MKKSELRKIIREELLQEELSTKVKELSKMANRINSSFPVGFNSRKLNKVEEFYPKEFEEWYKHWEKIDKFIKDNSTSRLKNMSRKWWNDKKITGSY